MNNAYEVIEVLRKQNNISCRKLGSLANMKPTTFESIMHRRPMSIKVENLDSIANVFGKHWYDLLGITHQNAISLVHNGKVCMYGSMQKEDDKVKYLKQINDRFYSYFDPFTKMLFALSYGDRGIYGSGKAWYLSVTYDGARQTIATFSTKDDGHKTYKEDYLGKLWSNDEVIVEAEKMVWKMSAK